MRQVIIENPIINSPFEEPRHHFRFSEDGITGRAGGSPYGGEAVRSLAEIEKVLRLWLHSLSFVS